MTFTLNGNSTDIKGRHPHLLSALRDELGVISPKDGCAPSGECGCCVVLIDGRAATSCDDEQALFGGALVVWAFQHIEDVTTLDVKHDFLERDSALPYELLVLLVVPREVHLVTRSTPRNQLYYNVCLLHSDLLCSTYSDGSIAIVVRFITS